MNFGNIRRGMELLDKEDPEWIEHIDEGNLNIGSSDSCVLGQRYGSYNKGLAKLDISDDVAPEYGFQINKDIESHFMMRIAFFYLTYLWRMALHSRRQDSIVHL